MKIYFNILFLCLSFIFAFVLGYLLCNYLRTWCKKVSQDKYRRAAAGLDNNLINNKFNCEGFARKILEYMIKISYAISTVNSGVKISKKFIKSEKLNNKNSKLKLMANLPSSFNNYALRETQFRLAFILSLLFALLGSVFSYLLMVIMFVLGIFAGIYLPIWAMKQEKNVRLNNLEKYLPEMLDVICLGLRSGLTFDRSLMIYTSHFKNNFSKEWEFAHNKWAGGICLREDALRDLAKTYESNELSRTIENIVRALRFGSSLVESLEESAHKSRIYYKTKQEEIVAKAPVKMMIPTGTLILPAMLMLVLGPVLLELVNGF